MTMKMGRKLFLQFTVFAFVSQMVFITCGFGGSQSQETVPLSSIVALTELSTKNKYYTIDETVRVEPPYYRFHIKSSHGEYDVLSIRDLIKVCHEIHIIEEYRATDQGGQAWNGASESLKNIGRGAMQIVKKPKESAKAFARAGGKLVRSIGQLFKEKKGEEKADGGTDRDKGGEGFLVGTQARKFAAEIGLDVYTDNPYAQVLIQEVAKARSKGAIGTSVGLFFLAPVQGLGLLSNSLTPNGFDAETEKLIRDESPAELRYVLNKKYTKELGVTSEEGITVKTLLDNPNYSPREQAYIYYYIKRLVKPESGTGVTGLLDVLDSLGKVKPPEAATFGTSQMELLYAYQQYAKDMTKFVIAADKPGAVTGKKGMIFIIPYDIVGNTPDMQKLLEEIATAAQAQGTKDTQLWFTGKVASDFVSKSKAKGVTIKENALKFPHFASKDKNPSGQQTK